MPQDRKVPGFIKWQLPAVRGVLWEAADQQLVYEGDVSRSHRGMQQGSGRGAVIGCALYRGVCSFGQEKIDQVVQAGVGRDHERRLEGPLSGIVEIVSMKDSRL